MWTGPGPEWATGGDTVVERLGSEARGRRRGTGGTEIVRFTCTVLDAILLKPCGKTNRAVGGLHGNRFTSHNLSFQQCTSKTKAGVSMHCLPI